MYRAGAAASLAYRNQCRWLRRGGTEMAVEWQAEAIETTEQFPRGVYADAWNRGTDWNPAGKLVANDPGRWKNR
jgi:hypothetical protein